MVAIVLCSINLQARQLCMKKGDQDELPLPSQHIAFPMEEGSQGNF